MDVGLLGRIMFIPCVISLSLSLFAFFLSHVLFHYVTITFQLFNHCIRSILFLFLFLLIPINKIFFLLFTIFLVNSVHFGKMATKRFYSDQRGVQGSSQPMWD